MARFTSRPRAATKAISPSRMGGPGSRSRPTASQAIQAERTSSAPTLICAASTSTRW